jgi:hypothetical protein
LSQLQAFKKGQTPKVPRDRGVCDLPIVDAGSGQMAIGYSSSTKAG